MIISFTHKGLKQFYESGSKAGIQPRHATKLNRILSNLDVTEPPDDIDFPGYRLHELDGNRKGIWSVTVQANWRITFRFIGMNVELVNYPELSINTVAPSLAPLLATNLSSIARKQWLRTLSEKSVANKGATRSSQRFMNNPDYEDYH